MKTRIIVSMFACLVAFLMLCAGFSPPSLCQEPKPRYMQDEVRRVVETPIKNDTFSFVVLGDNRDGDFIYEYLLEMAERLDVTFIANVGDVVHSGAPGEYENFVKIIERFKTPHLISVGNHERHDSKGLERYRQWFGQELNYYFDYGQCRFIFFDNAAEHGYTITDEQMEWFKKILDPDKIIFMFAHVPVDTEVWTSSFTNNSAEFMRLVESRDVERVYFGHAHFFDKMQRGNTVYYILGGAGSQLQPSGRFYSRTGGAFYHLLYVEVRGDEFMEFMFRPMEETMIGFLTEGERTSSKESPLSMSQAFEGYENTYSPIIESVEPASPPKARQPILINAVVYDDFVKTEEFVKKVTLYYSTDNGADWNSVPMTQDIGKIELWTATIPAQEPGAVIQYAVTAIDTGGNAACEIPGEVAKWPPSKSDVTSGRGNLFPCGSDPDDPDQSAPDAQDMIGVWSGYDWENIYVVIEFQGPVNKGTLAPTNVNVYGIGTMEPDRDLDPESVYLYIYAPLAPALGFPKEGVFSYRGAQDSTKPLPIRVETKAEGNMLYMKMQRDFFTRGQLLDRFQFIGATASMSGSIMDINPLDATPISFLYFRKHEVRVD